MNKFRDIAVGDEVVLVSGHGHPSAHKIEVTNVTSHYFDAKDRRWRKDSGREAGAKTSVWGSTRIEPVDEMTQKWLDRTEAKELVYSLSIKLDKLPLAALRTIDQLVQRAEWFEQNPPPQDAV